MASFASSALRVISSTTDFTISRPWCSRSFVSRIKFEKFVENSEKPDIIFDIKSVCNRLESSISDETDVDSSWRRRDESCLKTSRADSPLIIFLTFPEKDFYEVLKVLISKDCKENISYLVSNDSKAQRCDLTSVKWVLTYSLELAVWTLSCCFPFASDTPESYPGSLDVGSGKKKHFQHFSHYSEIICKSQKTIVISNFQLWKTNRDCKMF